MEACSGTLSSDTYHTAPGSCSPLPTTTGQDLKDDYVMSDSGVELRPSSRPQDDSDLSGNEDRVRKVYKHFLFDKNITDSF